MGKRIASLFQTIGAVTTLLLSSSATVSSNQLVIYGYIPPYTRNEENTFSFHIMNNSSTKAYCQTTIYHIFKGMKRTLLYVLPQRYAEPREVIDGEFVLSKALTKGLSVDLRFITETDDKIYFLDQRFIARDRGLGDTNKIIDPPSLENHTFVGKSNYLYLRGWDLESVYSSDKFVFSDYDQYYTAQYYHRLPLNDFNFIYSNSFFGDKLYYTDAFFEVQDDIEHNYFKYVSPLLSNGYRRIPLNIAVDKNRKVKTGTPYKVSLTNKMYVNPTTLIMSMQPLPGFVETKYFYFPKMGYNTQKITNFRLLIKNVGLNEYDVLSNLTYETEKAFLGNCSNSKYCIGSKYSDGISEKEEEIPL
jgi:hypothetical protein